MCLLVPTEKSVLTDDCDITPAIVHYTFGKNGIIDIQISNVTTSTFKVSPRAVVCELQPVSVDLDYGVVDSDNSGESILDQVSVETMGLSESDIHTYVFSTGDTGIGHCTFARHSINLTDEVPFKQRRRPFPSVSD